MLSTYADADWAGDSNKRKSTSGFCLYLLGNLVACRTLKQTQVATSTTELEYIVLSECLTRVKWTRNILGELGLVENLEPTTLYEDKTGVWEWASGGRRTKHVERRYHFVQEEMKSGSTRLHHCSSGDMIADVFTKRFPARVTRSYEVS